MVTPVNDTAGGAEERPAGIGQLAQDLIIDLDVREDLRNGREPFSRILAARRSLAPGGALRLRAIFEPVPLYAVMAGQGLAHWTERLAPDDWVVWFYPPGVVDTAAASVEAERGPGAEMSAAAVRAEAEPVILDVRGLEPPEPLVRTLEALEALPPGGLLIQLNTRVPQFLLPQLRSRGYAFEVHEEADDRVRLLIRVPDPDNPQRKESDA
jgi:TusA-related sulfurtransferase